MAVSIVSSKLRWNIKDVANHVFLTALVKHVILSQAKGTCLGVLVVGRDWLCGVPNVIRPVLCSFFFVGSVSEKTNFTIGWTAGVVRLAAYYKSHASCKRITEDVAKGVFELALAVLAILLTKVRM